MQISKLRYVKGVQFVNERYTKLGTIGCQKW